MYRSTLPKGLAFKAALRLFSASATRSALKINLAGEAEAFKQTLHTKGDGIEQHIIKTDAFRDFGGTDLHPDPIQYLFASISGCQQITAHLVAKDLGIKLGKANINTEADLALIDKRQGIYPGYVTTYVTVDYEVETDATDEQFAELREVTEAKCPIANVFINSKGLTFTSNWKKLPFKQ